MKYNCWWSIAYIVLLMVSWTCVMTVVVVKTGRQYLVLPLNLVFSVSLGLGFLFFIFANMLLIYCQIWSLNHFVTGSSLKSIQADLNRMDKLLSIDWLRGHWNHSLFRSFEGCGNWWILFELTWMFFCVLARLDESPLVDGCKCYTCRKHSRAYIYHLLNTHEMLAQTLLDM
jgi:hypothetical protein